MNRTKIKKFMQSFVAIPLIATSLPFSGISSITSSIAEFSNTANGSSVIITQENEIRVNRAEAIDEYFRNHDAPLVGYGMKFVTEAEKYNLDWRLLPAIAMRESTGGKHACKRVSNSVFGYGSCRINFKSIDESIEIVAKSLGGENPNTARYYKYKTTEEKLKSYNPDSIIPGYSKQVVRIMDTIGNLNKA
jgi:hypothetical protein